MFEVAADGSSFEAVLLGQKRHVTLVRVVGHHAAGDAIRVVEVDAQGHKTGRACFARVTFVERVSSEVAVLSIDVRMSTDHLPAHRG